MRSLAARYLTAGTARVIALTLMAMAVASVVAMFAAPARPGGVIPALGGDFAGFYAAGTVARQYGFERLYDPALQDAIVHRLQPSLKPFEGLPFGHPPFVGLAFALLAAVPYPWAVAFWLLVSAALYLAAVWLLLHRSPGIPPAERTTALLLALSFPPFIFECWVGGQLSAVAVAAVTLAVVCRRNDRPLLSGLALAILCYKPSLLVLLVPLLLIERSWKSLIGFGLGVVTLAGVSILGTGLTTLQAFVHRLESYAGTGGSAGAMFRTFKYVDLPAFLRLLHLPRPSILPLALVIAAIILALIAVSGWRSNAPLRADLAWAVALCLTPVLNVYGPIYDVALIVPGVILAGDVIGRTRPGNWPAFVKLVAGLYACALLAPLTALWLDFQLLTPALAATAVALARLGLATPRAEPRATSSERLPGAASA